MGLFPAYTSGFISLEKQFLTLGINGLVEAAEFLGYEPTNNERYLGLVKSVLKVFSDKNKEARVKYNDIISKNEYIIYGSQAQSFDEDDLVTIKYNGDIEEKEFLVSELYKLENWEHYKVKLESGRFSQIKKIEKITKKLFGLRFNTEFVPAENLGVKNFNFDKKDGLIANREVYNSYFYPSEDIFYRKIN
jgi:hypothetical protein